MQLPVGGCAPMEFKAEAFSADRPTSKTKQFWAGQEPPQPTVREGEAAPENVHEWHSATRTDDWQQLPKMPPPHDTIIVKDKSYFDGTYKESLQRNRFDTKLRHNLDNWARDQELRRQVLDWQASEAHAVDLLAQKEYAQQRTRDRKVERIHLETCSGAYFVRPSDHEVIEGIDEGELAYRTNGETATLLKTLATQVPLDVLHADQMASQAEASQTMSELDAFDRRVGGVADSDDE